MSYTPEQIDAIIAKQAQLNDAISGLLGRRNQTQLEQVDWWAGTATGGPNGDGRYPATGRNGEVRLIPSPLAVSSQLSHPVRGPEFFGAIGDGKSHPAYNYYATIADLRVKYPFATSLSQEMDWLGWQLMVNTRGVYACPNGANYIMCNGDPATHLPISWCAGLSDVDGLYGRMDWSALRFTHSDQHLMPNYNFATPDGWFNTSDYDNQPGWIIYANFTKGYAECIDDKAEIGARNPYYEFKHPVALAPGRYRARMSGTATRGVSYHYKNGNPPYCTMHFNGVTNRSVTVFPILDRVDPENVEVEFSGQFDFEVTANSSGNIVFKGGGYVNLKVRSIDIVPFIANCAILNHRDGPVDHYFISRRLRNILIQGPYNDADNAGLSCGIWKSFSSIDGSLQDWEGIKIFGFDMPFNWQDGAYLINYYGCDVESRGRGCYFGPGSVNAGENIKFYWGSISGGKCAFTNPGGAEFSLFGTIVDYNEQLCAQNAGKIRLFGTRHEQHIPTDPAKPIWHCTTGRVIYEGSYVLLAGGVNESPCPPAKLDTHLATMEFNSTEVYNMSSAAGVSAEGAGRVSFSGFLNNGNPNIGPDLISRSASMDMLGGAGTFEPFVGSYFYHNDASQIDLIGGLNDSDTGGMIDRWNSANIKCEVVTTNFRTGTRSLKVTKLKGQNNNVYSQLYFLVPLPAPGNLLGVMYFQFPEAIKPAVEYNADGTIMQYPIYFRNFYVQVNHYDVLGRPIIARNSQFKGETDFYIDGTGDPTWQRRSLNTTYGQPTPDDHANERSPAWATHYMVAIDIQNMPAMSFYIDDFQINFLA